MRKRILFVTNTLGRAGAETALLTLLAQMDRRRYEICMRVLSGNGELFA